MKAKRTTRRPAKKKRPSTRTTPASSARKLSVVNIEAGDVPTPDRGYCPFPLEVWKEFDRGSYYRALNKISLGVLLHDPALHLHGLQLLYDLSCTYTSHVNTLSAKLDPDSIYCTIRSGTGNFRNCILWVRDELIANMDNPAYRDSLRMLAVFADPLLSPNNFPVEGRGLWVPLHKHVPSLAGSRVPPKLETFSRYVFKDIITDRELGGTRRDAIDRILTGHDDELTVAHFWKVKEHLDTMIQRGDGPGDMLPDDYPFWVGTDDDLFKLFSHWKTADKSIKCSFSDFTARMKGQCKGIRKIFWLEDDQDLAFWIYFLSTHGFITKSWWNNTPYVFRPTDIKKSYKSSSLKSMGLNKNAEEKYASVEVAFRSVFPSARPRPQKRPRKRTRPR